MKHSIPKPLAVVLSYPSNPTAMTVGLDFYTEVVQLAKKLDLIILSDLAYAEIYFDGIPPPSVLQVPGAIDITVEFTSLSKTYAMPGWRMGFAVGNERLIGALGAREVLSRLRRLHAGAGGGRRRAQRPAGVRRRDPRHLQEPPGLPGRELRARGLGRAAAARLDVRLGADPGGLSRARLAWSSPSCWSSKADVAVSPGLGFGEYGEGFVRIALVENEHRIRQAARNIKKFLARSRDSMHNVIPIPQKAAR